MADITGNFGVNTHSYNKNDNTSKKTFAPAQNAAGEEEVKKPEINLNNDAAAISGKAMIGASNVGKKQGGYVFDPKKVEEDVHEFQAYYAVKDVMDEYKADLIEKGYDPTAAEDQARMFADCLLSNQNV